MADYIVRSGNKIYDSGPGPIRATIEVYGKSLMLFRQKEANDLVRAALQSGGDLWVNVFLPMRFSDYAKQLGYHINQGGKYYTWKKAHLIPPIPLVGIGGAAAAGNSTLIASQKAHAEATSKGTGGVITIRIPTGHALQAKDQAVFRQIPAHEVKRIAQEVDKTLGDLLSGYSVTTNRVGKMTATLGGSRGSATTPKPRGSAAAGKRKAA